jgi:phospholipid/cholesterol/gamma-HCH transport system substrate-binding protein
LPEADPRQVSIADPSGLVMFDTQKLLSRDKNGEVTPGDLQWSDTVPKLVQRKVAQTLDQAGFRYASAGQDGGTAGATVQTEIRAFQIDRDPDLHADIALALRVVGRDGKVADARVFTASAPAESADGPQAAEAMNVAFGHILGEIAPWVADAVAKLPAAPAGDDNEPAPPPPPVPAPDGP